MGKFLTPEDVAARLQVSPLTVRRWLRAGSLRGTKAGRQWRIREDALEQFTVDHVASFDENAQTFTRWAQEIHDAALAAALCAGERDLLRLSAISNAADTLLDALGDWNERN